MDNAIKDSYALKKKKILILSDSLSLPRNKPEIVIPNETWPSLLTTEKEFEVTIMAMGGSTLKKLYEQSHYYTSFDPDFVIIQCGIVDCAPRAFGLLEKEIINSNKLLSAFFHKLMPINFLRRFRKKTYTPLRLFSYYIEKLLDMFAGKKIVWIGIVPACDKYENKINGIQKNINIYNNIIEKKIDQTKNIYIDTLAMPIEGIMSDHHHLNRSGHEWIYFRLIEVLKSEFL